MQESFVVFRKRLKEERQKANVETYGRTTCENCMKPTPKKRLHLFAKDYTVNSRNPDDYNYWCLNCGMKVNNQKKGNFRECQRI